MKVLVVLLSLLIISARASAAVWACSVGAVYALATDGTLVPERMAQHVWRVGDEIHYDEATGMVRFVLRGSPNRVQRLQFEVWQLGSNQNSAIALFRNVGPVARPLMTLRVLAFSGLEKKPFTFADEDGSTITGVCVMSISR